VGLGRVEKLFLTYMRSTLVKDIKKVYAFRTVTWTSGILRK
jgi:hypothetical protein